MDQAPTQEPTSTGPTTETKTETKAESKEGETLLSKGKEEKPATAPEKYEDFKVPEGFELDPEVSKQASELFKGLNIPQEGAQKLVDFYVKNVQDAFNQPFETMRKMREDWRNEANAHPDLKGKLEKGGPILQSFDKLLNTLDNSKQANAFREAMDLTGVGDHPAFIWAVQKWASLLTEGTHVSGKGPSKEGQTRPGSGPPTAAKALYPNLP